MTIVATPHLVFKTDANIELFPYLDEIKKTKKNPNKY